MPPIQDRRGPYASAGSVQTVIEKHRQVGLPSVDLRKLQQIGITESLAPRTLHTLEALGFYDSTGNVTPEFDALRKVPDHDFKARLAALLREAYAPILEVLDPSVATQTDVENAFRGFEPTGQIPRMVQLFMRLMAYVDLMPDPDSKRRPGSASRAAKNPKPKTAERGQGLPTGRSGHLDGRERHSETQGVAQRGIAEHASEALRENGSGERRDVSLGNAGSVTIIVNVRWLDLSDDQFAKLRKLIKDIEALGASGSDRDEQVEVSP